MDAELSQVNADLELFLQFTCRNRQVKGENVIRSSINVLRKCPSSRQAILVFYSNLLNDLITKYIDDNSDAPPTLSKDCLLYRLLDGKTDETPLQPERKWSEQITTGGSSETPASPQPSEPVDAESRADGDSPESYDNFFQLIGSAFESFNQPNSRFFVDWALEFISSTGSKYSTITCAPQLSPIQHFAETIKFWTNCPVIKLLLKVIQLPYHEKKPLETQEFIKKLITFSPGSDWICAYLITSLPTDSESELFSLCIQFLLESQASQTSLTNILSYISEHNPQAIIIASQMNIPFLLRLSSNSMPLLNLMALEAVKKVNVQFLNELSSNINEDLTAPIIYCILNAPNAYDLIKLLFDAGINRDASEPVKSGALRVLSVVIDRIHEIVYTSHSSMASKSVLSLLESNIDHLIRTLISRSTPSLRKLQLRLLKLLCLNFGLDFSARAFYQMLNNIDYLTTSDGIKVKPIEAPLKVNPMLFDLVNALKLSMGCAIYDCFNKAVEFASNSSNDKFWANMLAMIQSHEKLIELDIDQLTRQFTIYMRQRVFDEKLYFIVRCILFCVERRERQAPQQPRHHLSISLMACYLSLVDHIDDECAGDLVSNGDKDIDWQLLMTLVGTAQRLMFILSQCSINQSVLVNCLVETELRCEKRIEKKMKIVSLLAENICDGGATKYRKTASNISSYGVEAEKAKLIEKRQRKAESVMRRQLLLDAIKQCTIDLPSFAALLVDKLTPDVMFNYQPWPEDDFIKAFEVTIERDLQIARKFDENPVLWDFFEYLAVKKQLIHCSALIRALMAVHLTHWSSMTATDDRIDSTQRLLALIAKSELVPYIPFKYLPEAISSLTPWEIFCVLNDIWRYLKDVCTVPNDKPVKPYLEKLRIILAQKQPGPLFVNIFKNVH